MSDERYHLEQARAYWRHAPSGQGKHDTTALSVAADRELLTAWDEAFRSRFRGYPEEDLFVREFAKTVRGERILSIGTGLGFHEIFYQAAGAQLTCADIVPSNLKVIDRVSKLKGLGVQTVLVGDDGLQVTGAFETVFIYGSLMAMPRQEQQELLSNTAAMLVPGGRIVLMLYTWAFASTMCGWSSADQFDPLVFARASDPSVGPEDCPWSDWHDDAAVLDLAGGEFGITKKQLWNREFYSWYELKRGASGPADAFFTGDAMREGTLTNRVTGAEFVPSDATATGPGAFATSVNGAHYAALSPEVAGLAGAERANAVQVSLTLYDGCVSVGLLDVARGRFVANAVVIEHGTTMVRLLVDAVPAKCQVVVSNHFPERPGSSRFAVNDVEFRAVNLAEPPATPAL